MSFEFKGNDDKNKLSRFAQKQATTSPICDRGDKFMLESQYKRAVEEYLTSIMAEGSNIRPYKAVSKAYKNLKAYDKAIKHLENAKEICQFDPEIYYELGLNHLLNASPEYAIKNFIRTIKLDKNNLNAQLQLAISHELSDEIEMAFSIYQKIIEENPHFIIAYNHKAGLHIQLKQYFEAVQLFKKILEINPEYYRANLGLGICFDKLEKYSSAIRYYKKYIAAKPKSETAHALVNRICEIYNTKPEQKQKQTLRVI